MVQSRSSRCRKSLLSDVRKNQSLKGRRDDDAKSTTTMMKSSFLPKTRHRKGTDRQAAEERTSQHLPTAATTTTTTTGTPIVITTTTSVVVSTSIGAPGWVGASIATSITAVASVLLNMRVGALGLEVAHLLAVLTLDARNWNKSACLFFDGLDQKTYHPEAWGTPCQCDRNRRSCGTGPWTCRGGQCTPWPCDPPHRSCDNPWDRPWGSPWRSDQL